LTLWNFSQFRQHVCKHHKSWFLSKVERSSNGCGTNVCILSKTTYRFGRMAVSKLDRFYHICPRGVKEKTEDGSPYTMGVVYVDLEPVSILLLLAFFLPQFDLKSIVGRQLLPQFCQAQVELHWGLFIHHLNTYQSVIDQVF
jgi:hypothetical protein